MSGEPYRHPLTWITDRLAVGSAPMSYQALDSLREQGVAAILNLCAEFTDLHTLESGHGFEVYHLPVEDEGTPELEELEKALDWLDEAIYLGKKVLIHCRHGIGRTGTVLNAYILRRGLGHRRAWLKLRGLRSQPANFRQWRMVRRYGKGAVPLTLRTPTLEHRRPGGPQPFSEDLGRLLARAEEAWTALPPAALAAGRLGRDHARGCTRSFDLSLAEAAHLHSALGSGLSRADRQALAGRAATPGQDCPLLRDGACQAFDLRPLRCRLLDLPGPEAARLEAELAPAVAKASREVYQALTGQFMPEGFPRFSVADAVAGRHVQAFFDWQRRAGRAKG